MPLLIFSSCFKEPQHSTQKSDFDLSFSEPTQGNESPVLIPGVHSLVFATDFLVHVETRLT